MVIENDYYFWNNVIDQQDKLEVDGNGNGGSDGINPTVAETAIVNETKGLKISWRNCHGGIIILTQPYFSIPSMTFTNMLEMWFCGDIYKNLPPYRNMTTKYVNHVKGGKQKLSNMKSLVKQVIRYMGVANRHDLVVQKWSPRKLMYLYLGVRNFLAFPCLYSENRRCYEKSYGRHISMRCWNGRANYLEISYGMSRPGGIGLVTQ